jgi:uncharacterized membrane protein HdeD (DUF308 family)
MSTVMDEPAWEVEERSVKWWVLLLSGVAWILLGVVVLDFDLDSAATVGFLIGAFLILGAVTEFMLIGIGAGWKWLHGILGVLFALGGIAAFLEPLQTFGILARMFGFLLVLKGTFDFVLAIAMRHSMDLWWMMLLSGIFEIILGMWASSYPGRSAQLLILWVGIGAVIRGVTQLILSFQVKKIEAVTA